MRAYFTAALYQKDEYLGIYKRIVVTLRKQEVEVFEDTTTTSLEVAMNQNDVSRVEYYKKVLKWIDKCDLVVVEASFPSTLSIGHEITLALEKSKPVVVLYLKGKEPTFLMGLKDERIQWVEYTLENLEEVLSKATNQAKDKSDVRFNFFVSPKIITYLDWVAQHRRVPKSVFLRDLIEKEMRKDKEFKE